MSEEGRGVTPLVPPSQDELNEATKILIRLFHSHPSNPDQREYLTELVGRLWEEGTRPW